VSLLVDQLFVHYAKAEEEIPYMPKTCPEIPELEEEHIFSATSSDGKGRRERKYSAGKLERLQFPAARDSPSRDYNDTVDHEALDDRPWRRLELTDRSVNHIIEEPLGSFRSSPSTLACLGNSCRINASDPKPSQDSVRRRRLQHQKDPNSAGFNSLEIINRRVGKKRGSVSQKMLGLFTNKSGEGSKRGSFFESAKPPSDVAQRIWKQFLLPRASSLAALPTLKQTIPARTTNGIHLNTVTFRGSAPVTTRVGEKTPLVFGLR